MSHKVIGLVLVVLLVTAMLPIVAGAVTQPANAMPAPLVGSIPALATNIGTGFTYQGQLKSGSSPVNGSCDLQFGLWDDASGGAQISTTQTSTSVSVTNGLFTTKIDFGIGALDGEARWLAIAVRCPAGSGAYSALSPRQPLTPAPYALALPGLYTQQNTTSPNLIGGYSGNVISDTLVGGTIGGGGYSGSPNQVLANYATIGGGSGNVASEINATVDGGHGNIASGYFATVGGGVYNTASGYSSFAVGNIANAVHNGSFVWSDLSFRPFTSTLANQFSVRATGGVRMVLAIDGSGNPTWSCSVSNGGSWSCSSDRNLKENLRAVDGREVLERLSRVPIFTWNAKGADPKIKHVGPTAQDFYAAFNVGEDDTHLSTIDAEGVALAAIQGLNQVVREQDARIDRLENQNADLQARLTALEQALQTGGGKARSESSNVPPLGLVFGGLALVGLVGAQRRRSGEQR